MFCAEAVRATRSQAAGKEAAHAALLFEHQSLPQSQAQSVNTSSMTEENPLLVPEAGGTFGSFFDGCFGLWGGVGFITSIRFNALWCYLMHRP
jgi:hypothetical protein